MNAKPDDQDPSMDDILASIRRIMLDEQARLKESGPAPQAAGPAAAPEEPPPSVLVLDASMAVHEPAPEEPAPEPGPDAVIMTALDPVIPEPVISEPATTEPVAAAPPAEAAPAEAAPTGPFSQLDAQALEALLAPAAAAAATASVDAMLRQLQAERDSFLREAGPSGPSLEQVVCAELRPMLKAWLDQHLPEMVERLVRAELARLTLRHTP